MNMTMSQIYYLMIAAEVKYTFNFFLSFSSLGISQFGLKHWSYLVSKSFWILRLQWGSIQVDCSLGSTTIFCRLYSEYKHAWRLCLHWECYFEDNSKQHLMGILNDGLGLSHYCPLVWWVQNSMQRFSGLSIWLVNIWFLSEWVLSDDKDEWVESMI